MINDRKPCEYRVLCSVKPSFKNEGKCQGKLQVKKISKILILLGYLHHKVS